ncbi:non-ribosomal peptide synthetase [Coleofasciculus sp. FACHB-501]|uniref:non-ribosomal peptide synthetase n=1 Tax=Cyanophyceae TaxID=3028117 RepID=UPI0018F04802|nr:non-ribosomal peptide synthetase [Coleofasciculus sp. FACHB-501]
MKVENLEDIYELSPMQQGLLFHTLYAPKSAMYFEQYSWTVQGDFNALAFKQAWQQVIDRHPILRTAFFWQDLEKPYQVVYRQAELIWEEQDWRHSQELQAERLEMFLQADRDRDFDLSQAPLMRLALIRLANDTYQVVWSHHHILLDGWSGPLVFQEVYAFYQAFCQGQELHLERPRPFREYITWLQQQDLSKAEAFWRKTLQGFTAPTPLGLDRMHNQASLENKDNEQQIKLSQAVSAALEALARQHRLTINTLVQGAWAILLSRYSGEQDVIFGAISSGRPTDLVGVESIVGMFVNTLPMRVDVNPEAELLPWLNRFQAQQAEMRQYEYSPLVKIQGWSELPANVPLFESTVTLENYPVEPEQWEENRNLKIDNLRIFEKTNYPLTIMAGTGAELSIRILCDRSRFDTATISRMLGHFQTLLESIAANPNQRLGDLPILTAAERYQLLVEFNQTQYYSTDLTPQPPSLRGKGVHDAPLLQGEGQGERLTQEYCYPTKSQMGQCIHQLFEKQVEQTPDAIAVIFDNQQLTYTELNSRANQLAHHLQKLGVKPEVLVGICMERSLEMVIGLLGILKAGGAYVPLDPKYPQERLAFMLEDTQASVLLTQQQLIESLPNHNAKVVCLDTDWQLVAQQNSENQAQETTTADNLAYIIYTSGSTGKPKGVAIAHHNTVALIDWAKTVFTPADMAGVLASTSICFDLSIFELFVPLSCGGTVILAENALYLPILPAAERVTLINTVPSAIASLLRDNAIPATVRTVNLAGEPLPNNLVQQLYQLNHIQQVFNLYGPSEDTTYSTYALIERGSQGTPPIGRPIANTQVYVLDNSLQPVPIGVAGELYLGGAGLARGYLNRPELTAEKFIANPFNQNLTPQPPSLRGKGEPDAPALLGDGLGERLRLYKTGDLVRYLPDGNLEFLGRIDHQVKIRGFRIELGEIEAVLAKHPAIEQTVVLAQEDDLNTHRLVAYLTTKQLPQDLDKLPEIQWHSEHVSEWKTVFEKTYHQNSNIQEDTLNISGWNSSYTGLPIPAEEMRMWVDSTVEQILALKPSRILEIGCGSGLLLFPIAPHCSHYLGTDFSQSALDYIQQQLTTQNLPQVTLDRRLADNFEGIEAGAFDVVIINSVIQYFPSTDYLLRVLEGAVNAVKPGGSIFIGDVRSLPLLEAFHTSVQLHQAPSNLSITELRQRIQKRLQQEQELIIDPEFFRALKHEFSKISHVQIQPKPGKYQNELTKFRYDVILRVGAEVDCLQDFPWLNWQKQNPTLGIRQLLEETNPEILGITGIPNARLLSEMKTLELLAENDGGETVADLRKSLQESNTEDGIESEEILALGQDLSYCIHLNYSGNHYDAVFVHKTLASPEKLPAFLETSVKVKPWRNYANNPLQGKVTRELVPQLRDYLQEKLPEYMVPSNFILLEEFPLTPNGKIDRRSLITLSQVRPELEKTFVAPRTPIEQTVANIYAQILNLQQVGASDNFFELGGHSLLATQVTSRLRETFQVELPLRTLFESPTVAELAEVISSTQQAKQSLDSSSIPRVSRNQPLPLSFAQQRLWFLDNLEPGSPDYNIPAPVRLVGQLDIAALEQSFNEIVRRHEILRTRFVMEGQPIQEIAPAMKVTFPIIDLQAFPEADREVKIQQLIAQEALQPFDLTQAPLFRIQLLQLGEEEHILVLVLHHIIFDLWSIGVLLQEVTELYKAFTTGEISVLPELPIQYADFAVWQRQYLQGEVLEKHLSYWKQQLGGNLPVLELPSDRSRSAVQSNRGAIHYLAFPKDLSDAIQAFSQREGATLFMTLSAAFKTLLYAYTGQQDILIGSPIANRDRVELELLIGFFVNTLVLRTDLSGNPSFRELLARVREVTLGAYAHQDLPFEKLVEALKPNRKKSEFPLFKVWFALENAPIPDVKLPKLTLSSVEFYSGIARYDLRLGLTETAAGLRGSLEYKTELFDAANIARIVGNLEAILRQAVAQPEIRLEQLASAIAQAEQQQQIAQEKELAQTSLQKLKRVKRKAMHG